MQSSPSLQVLSSPNMLACGQIYNTRRWESHSRGYNTVQAEMGISLAVRGGTKQSVQLNEIGPINAIIYRGSWLKSSSLGLDPHISTSPGAGLHHGLQSEPL